jgi:hypothetical protein
MYASAAAEVCKLSLDLVVVTGWGLRKGYLVGGGRHYGLLVIVNMCGDKDVYREIQKQ